MGRSYVQGNTSNLGSVASRGASGGSRFSGLFRGVSYAQGVQMLTPRSAAPVQLFGGGDGLGTSDATTPAQPDSRGSARDGAHASGSGLERARRFSQTVREVNDTITLFRSDLEAAAAGQAEELNREHVLGPLVETLDIEMGPLRTAPEGLASGYDRDAMPSLDDIERMGPRGRRLLELAEEHALGSEADRATLTALVTELEALTDTLADQLAELRPVVLEPVAAEGVGTRPSLPGPTTERPPLTEEQLESARSFYGSRHWNESFLEPTATALGISVSEANDTFISAIADYQYAYIGEMTADVNGKADRYTRQYLTYEHPELAEIGGYIRSPGPEEDAPEGATRGEGDMRQAILNEMRTGEDGDPSLPERFEDWVSSNVSVGHTFMGVGIEGGIHRDLAGVLQAVEQSLGVSPDRWGIYRAHGWDNRRGGGLHPWGCAIDLNYSTNPFVMHESGERGSRGEDDPENAASIDAQVGEVYERIAQLMLQRESVIPANMISSDYRDTIDEGGMWDLLAAESAAMRRYFALMQDPGSLEIFLRSEAGQQGMAAAFPGGGVDAEALQQIMAADWVALSGREGPQLVDPSGQALLYPEPRPTPGNRGDPPLEGGELRHRSPASGFMDLRRELVVALSERLRWGGFGFGRENGDLMHFDTAPFGIGRKVKSAYNRIRD